jgi:GMP synthase-like glutamine amidotransferase
MQPTGRNLYAAASELIGWLHGGAGELGRERRAASMMTLRVTVVDCGSKKVAAIGSMLEEAGARVDVVALDDVAESASADALVISGGPRLFTSEPGLIDAFAFVDSARVPVLGICLGHQAIALRHGARVFLGPERRQSETIVRAVAHPLMAGLPTQSEFVEDHCEGITLPTGFVALASSSHYDVEVMASDVRRLYGVQFHPEVSGPAGQRLLSNFVELARG